MFLLRQMTETPGDSISEEFGSLGEVVYIFSIRFSILAVSSGLFH